MNDEELVEVIARRFRDGGFSGRFPENIAEDALAALRSAGFQIVRSEDPDGDWE